MTEEPLEELPELAELEPLDEPSKLPEFNPDGGATAQSALAAESSPPAPKAADSGLQKRQLEQAPIILRKAAKIVLIGSLLPWLVGPKAGTVPVDWLTLYGAKALALLAGWVFHQAFMATHGGKAWGFLDHLSKAHKLAVPILAGLIAVGSFVPIFMTDGLDLFAAIGEVTTLLLAAATFSHIFGYEHGGRFNPIFPLMFLGPGIAGLLGIFGAVGRFGGDGNKPALLAGLVGLIIVGVGGMMAIYTMVVAMKQAKLEGDLKRTVALEQRKAARAARKAR
ncbi:MAG: hypothetical protein E2O39_13730 [Planctomycetota bacterium]|nr:MAG: hypothetical protein E2O39_13730 [Planctomycetota bacterium]